MNKAKTMSELIKRIPKYRRQLIQKHFTEHRLFMEKMLKTDKHKKVDYFSWVDRDLKNVLRPVIPDYEKKLKRTFTEDEKICMCKSFDGLYATYQTKTITGMINQLISAIRDFPKYAELRHYTPDIKIKTEEILISQQTNRVFTDVVMENHVDILIKAGDLIKNEFWNNVYEDGKIYMPDDLIKIMIKKVESNYVGDTEITISPMHLEHNLLGATLRERQLSIFDIIDNDNNLSDKRKKTIVKDIKEYNITYQKIKLPLMAERVLRAIQKIMSDSDYMKKIIYDKDPKKPLKLRTIKGEEATEWGYDKIELPEVGMLLPEIFQAMGMKKYKTARGKYEYSGKEQQQVIEAIKFLINTNQWIYYNRLYTDPKTGETKKDTVGTVIPILKILAGWEGLDENETPEIRDSKHLRMIPSPIMIDEIKTYHVLRPANLHSEIREYFKGGKGTESVIKLIDFLFVQFREDYNFKKPLEEQLPLVVRQNYQNICSRLPFDSYFSKQNWAGMRKARLTVYKKALQAGYLLDYKTDVKGKTTEVDELTLNPDKFFFAKIESKSSKE